jgi:HDOD domain
MSTATKHAIRETVPPDRPGAERGIGAAALAARRSTVSVPAPAARLAELLADDPVDLTRVSDEIRALPSLAAMAKRVAASLLLCPKVPVTSVEEAAVLLGTDRLRVLLHAWPFLENTREGETPTCGEEIQSPTDGGRASAAPAISPAWTPETLYLATFVCFLDLGTAEPSEVWSRSQTGAACTEITRATQMLVRDFLMLLPSIDPRSFGSRTMRDVIDTVSAASAPAKPPK